MDNSYLCRGKRVDNGEWVVGDFSRRKSRFAPQLDTTYGISDEYGTFCAIDPATCGRCTGLLAAKSYRGDGEMERLIFEGDVYKDCRGRICTVVWDAENARFLGVRTVGNDRMIAYVGQEPSVEIISTIHDNHPEMGGEKEREE